MGAFARDNNLHVELEGSLLSHSYYILAKQGVHVRSIDHGEPSSPVGVRNFGKIVRDSVPRIIEEAGEQAITRKASPDELLEHLKRKLVEEAFELYETGNPNDTLEESADVYEVIQSLLSLLSFSEEELNEAVNKKRLLRGGFQEGIYLEKTYVPPLDLAIVEDDQLFSIPEVASGFPAPSAGITWTSSSSASPPFVKLSVSMVPSARYYQGRVFDLNIVGIPAHVRVDRSGGELTVEFVGGSPTSVSDDQLRLW